MKRLLILAVMFLCCVATTFAQFSGSGSGTENDPYLILNPIQLNQLRNFLNQSNVYFKLMANIDLTEFLEDENPDQGWQPVGSPSASFNGILEGNGKTISGLWLNRSNSDNVGLFGCTKEATIKNINVEILFVKGSNNVGGLCGNGNGSFFLNCKIQSGKIEGNSYIGGICGNGGSFTNCFSIANILATGDFIGGITGSASGDIWGCRVNNTYITGVNYIGGIAGNYSIHSVLTSCYANTEITGNSYIGGIAGYISYYLKENTGQNIYGYNTYNEYYGTSVADCGFVGKIKGISYVGGIVGAFWTLSNSTVKEYYDNCFVKKCWAMGEINASAYDVGGIIGYLEHQITIEDCYYSGNIIAQDYVGGIVGDYHRYYSDNSLISRSFSNATISGNDYIGGIAGYNYGGQIYSCVSLNPRISTNGSNYGRIYGYNKYGKIGQLGSNNENKSYNRTVFINKGVAQDVNDDEQNGTGVSAKTLKLKATYVAMGWDFTDTWAIQETECYPYFKTQTAPPVITSQVVSGATTVSGKCVDGGTVTLEVDGVKQQMVSSNHEFSFTVSPLQAGHEVRVSAKAEGKEQSYYTTEIVDYLGKGTEVDPYQVYTASDLTGVYRKGYFKLMNDIDLTVYINQFSPTEGWESIGREGSETIHFDGNGKKITGLWCNSTRDNTGLFSCFANGTIKNLTVEVASGKQVKGGANTGILIGKMINGTIENCKVAGKVADGTPVGGLVGLFDGGKISLCQANVTINTTGETSYVGGLVGETTSGEIDQCFTQGILKATGKESYVAGLVGKNSATVTNCYSNAVITSSYSATGIVAYNYGVVDKCYATGNLFSSNYAAGIIGYNDGSKAVVKNCVAMNNKIDVTYESQQQQQGGGYGQRIIGGIRNGAPAPELNNYALKTMQVSVNNVAQKVYDDIMNGVGKNASDLLQASTYQELGWNFTDTWTINENENYPLLKNNTGASVKPGENPNPDPEPAVSDDDKIVVATVTATKGQQVSFSIDLENKTTDLTAYQFDLTLPDGVSLSVNDKGKFIVTKTSRYEDDSQTLNISKTEGNTYRFVCFSMSNEKITGTSGAILNAALTIGTNVNDGSYEATIANIVVTKTDGAQLKLKDAKFNVVVTNVIKGDANGDGEVNVSDIVEIVNYIMGKASANFKQAAADLNGDGEINVTDIVKVVSIIMGNSNAPKRASMSEMVDNDKLMLAVNGDKSYSISLDNEAQYVAAQFEIRLSEGQTLESISINGSRSDGHVMTYAKTGHNLYKVVVFSSENRPFKGDGGEFMSFKISDNGNVEVSNILFVTNNETERMFPSLYAGYTGIDVAKYSEPIDIYSVDGRMIRKQAENTNGLEKGLYIINGKKVIVK